MIPDELLKQAKWPEMPAEVDERLRGRWKAMRMERRQRHRRVVVGVLVCCIGGVGVLVMSRERGSREKVAPVAMHQTHATSPQFVFPKPNQSKETDPCFLYPIYPNGW